MKRKSVVCEVSGLRSVFPPRQISFSTGTDILVKTVNGFGPKGISPLAADLTDLASSIYQIDRYITSWRSTNPPRLIRLRMRVRRPECWTGHVVSLLETSLRLLSNAQWDIEFEKGQMGHIPQPEIVNGRNIKQVVLFSGGLDSTCGAVTLREHASSTQLVSYYTNQKSLQTSLATELGFDLPTQWHVSWSGGRARNFYLRSFFFLSLAAVVAESWESRTIYQFENGILATAIPPSPSWMMTKHAHPRFHKNMSELFSALFDGDWKILNPFLGLTKRECVREATKAGKDKKINGQLLRTESCWFLRSPQLYGAPKRPGTPCGTCVPCLIRLTAMPNDPREFNLKDKIIKSDEKKGAAFRAYYAFLSKVLESKKSVTKFYMTLPASGRDLAEKNYGISLVELHRLFTTFAKEFMQVYISK